MMKTPAVSLPRPDIRLLLDLEDALGTLAAFAARLKHAQWQVAELVTFRQVALEAVGTDNDYMKLGEAMLAEGLNLHRDAALAFLQSAGIGIGD